ncbi:glycosyl transferase family protein [Sulfuricella denitrificans skB26]|uniref:peptidoglycan glycosyltransferase n=1 Tax=Sulfuricella denitrificans (strain DSM 22764 / NBRC 105220 / skB26) TaxID=1163617 RepID=S6ACV2_SULDS|nr:transglycosylase domain-containing protein [Sulfuricella denitrificans]BAN35893.1 glycosyl transferase family protein [Sulfuricella denitrificans skB26]
MEQNPLGRSGIIKRTLKHIFFAFLILAFLVLVILGILIFRETESSAFQADYLSRLAKDLRWTVKSGPNPGLSIPQAGPYDERLGYSRLPAMIPRLAGQGFQVGAQARLSPRMQELVDLGLFIPYREKSQAGLLITDSSGQPFFKALSPGRVYENFEAVPSILVNSLLYIENRDLLDPSHVMKNPAVEWTRLGKAVQDKAIQLFRPEHDVPGGSTLATQIEKYRHSPNGLTLTASDKLQQIASASVRAYLDGESTLPARRRIVLNYLNTVPLAAVSGFGEVNGIGDGMWAWYGWNFNHVNRTLQSIPASGADLGEFARVYKHVLSLMIAQRRPSAYLLKEHKSLEELTNSHLRVLAQAGVISPAVRDAALKVKLQFLTAAVPEETGDFLPRKAASAVRVKLASLLGLPRLYELDRLDLSVQSTLDGERQHKVTDILRGLRKPEAASAAGLYGSRMLGKADPGKIIYSFTLHELTPQGAKLRVQADNFDQPFDINQGAKLDLGSTAKLRTLVTYLEIIESLHGQYASLPPKELRQIKVESGDNLTRWAIDYLLQGGDKSLSAMLDAAMERKYSANPQERFFTGGGVHVFHNFKHEDDSKVISVREATRFSVNLVYIRLMRDVVRYTMHQTPGANILKDMDDPQRQEYLKRFADKESKEFLIRFYHKYKGKSAAEIKDIFFSGIRVTPRRLAAAYRYLEPQATLEQFAKFMESRLPGFKGSDGHALRAMYESYGPGKYSLADQGYLANVHPLELWLVRYLSTHPGAQYKDMIAASSAERIDVYDWLLRTVHRNAQDVRIRSLIEVEAFLEIHRRWKRLGYPFDSLVPSLATAIGSSGDRPAALAELMGIILNDGVRAPPVMIEGMRFGADTPYETVVERAPVKNERLFSPELATTVRSVLIDVVEGGTASRLAHAIVREDGTQIPLGGKTGTGDHRYVTFSAAGVIKESRAVNRSATFVFFIGDRFFGSLTAFVPGADANDYEFTSSLSAQVLKHLLPTLKPLTDTARPLPEQLRMAAEKKGKAKKPVPEAEQNGDGAVNSTQQAEPETE